MISVVIPLYNKEKSITTTLQSVLDQTYTDYEVVVINDGSSDNSLEVVRNFVDELKIEDWRLKIVSQANGGVSSARNKGIMEAKGEYVALLDGDDLWDKEYLAEQVKMINDFPEAAMWGINFAETRNGQIIRSLSTGLSEGYRGYVKDYFHISGRSSDLFCSSSVVVRKDVFSEVGMFDERLKYSEDNDMWWRIIATYPVTFYDRYMVFYRCDAENRALSHKMRLRYDSPFVVDKYNEPRWKKNKEFYAWVQSHSAQWIARYMFTEKEQKADAYIAATKLDYSGYEIYQGKPIVYGLGNFFFDWKGQDANWNEGYMVKLAFGIEIELELIPYVQNADTLGIRLMSDTEKEQFFANIRGINEIIANPKQLQSQFEIWTEHRKEDYMRIILPKEGGGGAIKVSHTKKVSQIFHAGVYDQRKAFAA